MGKILKSLILYPLTNSFRYCSLSSRSNVQRLNRNIKMKVHYIPALSDNYMYLIVDQTTNICAAVDPVEPKNLLKKVQEENLHLISVLITHHHWDHSGGNKELMAYIPGITIYGGDDRIDSLTKKVRHNDTFKIGNLQVQSLSTPCHTSGHICYYVTSGDPSEAPVVFTGDTLFIGGCGRFFEGTAEQMYSAMKLLASLPPKTLVYCGHEYTQQNLHFASTVEPSNGMILAKLRWAQDRAKNGYPTVPSTIEEECKTNPFMRVHERSVQNHARVSDPVMAMKIIRQEKDSFKG